MTAGSDAAPPFLPMVQPVPPSDAWVVDAHIDIAPPVTREYRDLAFPTEETCHRLVVGTAREKATLCTVVDESLWRVSHRVMRVVRNGKRVVVLDVPAKIEGFDTGHTALESRVRISTDGMFVSVVGVPAGTRKPVFPRRGAYEPTEDCDHPTSWTDDPDFEGVPTFTTARKSLCAGLGTYAWTGDRFVRNAH